MHNSINDQDDKKARLIDYINWQVFVSLLIPLTSTLILAYNLYESRDLPQMTGNITVQQSRSSALLPY